MNWEVFGKKQSWPKMSWVDGPKEITKNLIEDSRCPARDSNWTVLVRNRMNWLELLQLPYQRCQDSGRRYSCYTWDVTESSINFSDSLPVVDKRLIARKFRGFQQSYGFCFLPRCLKWPSRRQWLNKCVKCRRQYFWKMPETLIWECHQNHRPS
jgi:hypothetical protein